MRRALPSTTRICQNARADVVIVGPIATRGFYRSTVQPITFCVRCARQNVGLCSNGMQRSQNARDRNPRSYKLDHAGLLKLVRDSAFVQLSVPFSAGSEPISFSLCVCAQALFESTHVQCIGNRAIIKISAGYFTPFGAMPRRRERTGNVIIH
jgi:hypothetical protein